MDNKPEFALVKLRLTLKAQGNFELPEFKGSTFRGAFGRVLKRVICIRRDQDCTSCLIKGICAYTFIFETELFYGQTKKVSLPRPFVLEMPSEDKKQYGPGDELELGLLLIGKGIDYLPYFIFAFEELGRLGVGTGRGRFQLTGITDAYTQSQIYSIDDTLVRPNYIKSTISKLKDMALGSYQEHGSLTFITPFRTKNNGHLTEKITIELIMRAILRRYMYLAELYFESGIEFDPNDIINKAREVAIIEDNTRWHDWVRYSSRQKGRMKLGGIVGDIRYANLPEDLWFWLILGQELHIGKNTTFGLGQYLLNVVDLQ